ncbi:uncharacterized protein DFL_001937 [Arthrobotrys flagrans]|uniref:Uncharacterized protein n=1 Tax=Arthrobotrys flagrans TaxID=97331 RepID=A0A437A934_ARTFL|nr:hypothetical protein DFL_001937 [Arthrobotrys flagrans]
MTSSLILTSASHQASAPDEEVAAEADEPSDSCNCNLSTGRLQFQENMYKKQTVNPSRSHKVDSLLTRAIISDSEPHSVDNASSIYSRVAFGVPRRGMSTTSTISSASMADLTSDAGDDSSSSELSSPSPRNAQMFVLPIRDTVAIKTHSDDELHKSTVQADPNEVTVALGRKRCITFACPTPASHQNSDSKPRIIEEPTPIRRTTLKFACNVKDECKAPKRAGSPPPPSKFVHRSPVLDATHLHPNAHRRRDSGATVVDERQKAIPCKASPLVSSVSSANSIPRFYEFASSVDESVQSWMNAPQFPPRLLKVDCLLEKEKQIRKLSEEVEEDEDNDDDDDVEDNDNLEFEDDDEEDDGYKEDEEDDEDDDEYEIWSDSDDNGNRSDGDGDVAGSDDEEDAFVPRPGTAIPDRKVDRPSCCRNSSDSSLASVHDRKSGLCSFQRERHIHARPIRPSTPELPDSTDFVPGTFDEDKVLEDFYLSCMEDRKSMNKVIRPQDIDPSFPEGGDDEEEEEEEAERPARRRRGSNVSVRSPTPNRRLRSPPPMSRRGSRAMSPGKRRPSFTARSPPPQGRTGRLRFDLQANRASLARSTSLPRHGLCSRRKHCLSSTSPKPSKAIPFRKRCALDIVKGLESKRMRRRENVYGRREYKAEAGEGVEKMREIGIMGRERVGANPAPKWMLSF